MLNLFTQAVAGLAVGESMVISKEELGNPQWGIRFTRTSEDRVDIQLFNQAPDGKAVYFLTDTAPDLKFGSPKLVQEPVLGIPCREAGIDLDGNLVGALVVDENGVVKFRGSWSKCVYSPKPEERMTYGFAPDGSFTLGGEDKGFVHSIFLPDKNRMIGWVAVVRPGKPEGGVKVLEMEELVLKA